MERQDKEWTKEETDYLFSVVQAYDSRWYIIHDRYEFPGGVPRLLEAGSFLLLTQRSLTELQDLKDRYYSVCRKLVRNRPWAGDEASKAQLISSFQFDKGKVSSSMSPPSIHTPADRELTRKKYLVSLENRTPEQSVEEEALYIEIRRLEQNERRFKRERDELLRTLAGIDSGLPDVIEDEGLMNLTVDVKKKKKGISGMDVDSPSTPVFPVMPAMKRPQSAKNAAFGIYLLNVLVKFFH